MTEFYYGMPYSYNYYNVEDKHKNYQDYVNLILSITLRMFEYKNLPETINARELELYLQLYGKTSFFKHDGVLRSLFMTWGGKLNQYYMPAMAIINNPALNININKPIYYEYYTPEDFKLVNNMDLPEGDELVYLIGNDSMFGGIGSIISRVAMELTELDITFRNQLVLNRTSAVFTAPNGEVAEAGDNFFNDLVEGKLSFITDDEFANAKIGVNPLENGTKRNFSEYIDVHNYIMSSLYKLLGISASTENKREYVSDKGVDTSLSGQFTLVDDMLYCRRKSIKKINEVFGLNIEVDLYGEFKDAQVERELEEEKAELENELIEAEVNETESSGINEDDPAEDGETSEDEVVEDEVEDEDTPVDETSDDTSEDETDETDETSEDIEEETEEEEEEEDE